jgi:hypothetical protein
MAGRRLDRIQNVTVPTKFSNAWIACTAVALFGGQNFISSLLLSSESLK